MCSYRFGVSKRGDKFKLPPSRPDPSSRIFKVAEAECYHVTLGYSSPTLEGQKPLLQLLLLLFVCVCVCVCLHTEFISLIHQDIFNGKIESYFYFFHKRGTCLHTSYSMLNYFH